MATAVDGKAPYESGVAGEKSLKRPFRPEINEEPQTLSQEAGQNKNSTGVSDQGGSSAATGILLELEHMKKQKTFTRSEIQHPTTMENLSSDLLLNIFIRLLAKQLAQMRCVSKYWNALLSESSFIKSHLHRSIHNTDQTLLLFYNNSSPFDPTPFRTYPRQSPHLELTNLIKLLSFNPKSGDTTSIIKVIGSVHGLICSCYDDDVIHIWNPSLSAVSTLPPYSMRSSPGYKIFFLFGYDPTTDDYKVVKVTGVTTPPGASSNPILPHVVKEWLQVEVYSMKKGSWEFVSQSFPSHVTMLINCDGACVDGHDGHLHWLGYIDEEGERQTIVAFDLGSETFREMPFPDAVLDGKRMNGLGVLGGKLCVMPCFVTDGLCEVWVMDEYGVAESWVKRHVFSLCIGVVVVVGITSQNEIFFEEECGRLFAYNPITHTAKILEYSGHGKYGGGKIVVYVDSLVWVAQKKLKV